MERIEIRKSKELKIRRIANVLMKQSICIYGSSWDKTYLCTPEEMNYNCIFCKEDRKKLCLKLRRKYYEKGRLEKD